MTDMGSESPKKTEEPAEEIPVVDEETVGELSDEVCIDSLPHHGLSR